MNRAERLQVAGIAAPRVRAGAERAAERRVALTDSEGRVVGYTTLAEVQAQILARAKIEFDVVDGTAAAETNA